MCSPRCPAAFPWFGHAVSNSRSDLGSHRRTKAHRVLINCNGRGSQPRYAPAASGPSPATSTWPSATLCSRPPARPPCSASRHLVPRARTSIRTGRRHDDSSAGLADRATEHGHGRRRRSAFRIVLRRTHPFLQEHHGCLEHADPYRNALHPCQHGGRLLRRGGGCGLRNEGRDAAPERAVSWWLSRICGHRRSLPHRSCGSGQRLGASPVAGACDRVGSRRSGPSVGLIRRT